VTAQRRLPSEAELVERLADLAPQLAWPEAPDLAAGVSAALEAHAAGAPRGIGLLARLGGAGRPRVARRSLVLAIVALLALAVAAAALGLGVPGIRIERGPVASAPGGSSPAGPSLVASPTPGAFVADSGAASAEPSGAPAPQGPPTGPELGPAVTLDDARSLAGFGVLVPTAAGHADPAAVYLAGSRPFARVTLRYPDQTLLTEFLGEIQPDAFQKIVGDGTTVTPVRIASARGWWITGAPHRLGFLYQTADGQTWWQEVTVTGNVLLWQAGDVTLRLETPLDLADAVDLAASLR
jgi:hypothetical protein